MLGLKLNHVSKRGHWWRKFPLMSSQFTIMQGKLTPRKKHESDITWGTRQLKSPTIRLFIQHHVQANNKDNIKAPHYCLLFWFRIKPPGAHRILWTQKLHMKKIVRTVHFLALAVNRADDKIVWTEWWVAVGVWAQLASRYDRVGTIGLFATGELL